MAQTDFDLFVIGGGSGGVRAARIAAGYGAKVGLAECDRFGGTCVICGCVPKKLLVYASRFADEFEDARGFGWTSGEATFDWATLIANKDREIHRLEQIYEGNLKAKGVATFTTRAKVDGPGAVKLADGQRITARTILIATGGRPSRYGDIPGAAHIVTSNEIFEMKTLPKRIVVCGGGYIAVEFASIFAGLGVETTLIHRRDKVLRGFDEDLRDGLMEALAARGIRLVMNEALAGVAQDVGCFHVALHSGGSLETDLVLSAIGREPATHDLGLETAGVRTGARGEIIVDSFSETTAKGIYAVGDVTDRVNLTPVAIREGHAFADTVFGERPTQVDHALVPTGVFTTPELATVGLSEAAARELGHELDIYKSRFRPLRNTLSGRAECMLMKLVVDRATDRVLGCQVLGPDAAEIVQTAAVALQLGASKADFDATVALHPSAAEELVTMREKWVPAPGI
ncbi:glutathione-disulfide reductase [Hyphomicrobium sp.]|uniref:glutathione-disulfide reductase n=1 Tax=Hyphomicrobium sp. TaxID=82 RepID=UPI0025BE2ADF|nr:glutathione-disulfide reductase [Hyphomicrobium sp.]MCC7250385.1 glutathione-disulfide reductase [Hyphomicrobium sp.]